MATTPTYINQRINNLQAQINGFQPYPPPELQTLSDVLILGNSAGSTDIDMNHQDIINVESILLNSLTVGTTTTISSSVFKIQDVDDYIQVEYNEVKVFSDALDSRGTLSATQLFVGENGGDVISTHTKSQISFNNANTDTGSGLTDNSLTIVSGSESISLSSSTLTFITPLSGSVISNTGGYDMTLQSSNQLLLIAGDICSIGAGSSFNVTAEDAVNMTSNADAVSITAQTDIIATSTAGNINLNTAVNGGYINMLGGNLNMNNATITPSFSVAVNGSIAYTFGGQAWDSVIIQPFTLPVEFLGGVSYTSTRWKLNWDMSLYNSTSFNDKAFAMYLDFVDTNANISTPFLYDDKTPYCNWTQPALYIGGIAPQYKPVNWGDFVDFNQLVSIGNGDLQLRVWYAGDNPMSCEFKFVLTLTKTNGI